MVSISKCVLAIISYFLNQYCFNCSVEVIYAKKFQIIRKMRAHLFNNQIFEVQRIQIVNEKEAILKRFAYAIKYHLGKWLCVTTIFVRSNGFILHVCPSKKHRKENGFVQSVV